MSQTAERTATLRTHRNAINIINQAVRCGVRRVVTVAANKTHEGDIMKLQKALAVIGAGVLLFAASDAITYAATGSSLVLGKINAANATTTIQNTGATPALRLLTKSTATAPMIVNGKGKVVNLYADRAATADNATKLGGLTVAQIKTAAKGATGAPGTPGAKGDPGTPGAKGDPGPRPVSVLWVAPSGGDYPTVSAALAAITDNGPAHPYLIKVAPGTYTETGSVVMKNYVDIEGSGQDMTTITCTCGSTTVPTADGSSAVLQVTGPGVHVWIRNLTITNMGSNLRYSTGVVTRTTDPGDVSLDAMTITATGGDHNYAIVNYSSSSTMTNVTATVTGGTGDSYGIHNFYSNATMTNVTATSTGSAYNYAIYSLQSSPTMTNVTATATGGNIDYGIENNSTVMSMMTHVTATATGGQTANWGILNNGGSSTILDSFVTGSTDSIYTPGGTVRVANTRLSGAVSGAMTCVGAYNATTFLALGTSCV